MSVCQECGGERFVRVGGYGEGAPDDEQECDRCAGSGEEPEPAWLADSLDDWAEWHGLYRGEGYDDDEASALAYRDTDREEQLVYY